MARGGRKGGVQGLSRPRGVLKTGSKKSNLVTNLDYNNICEINGIKFSPIKDVPYKYDYLRVSRDIKTGKAEELPTYRSLCLNDLFFFVYFVMRVPVANHDFWVRRCNEVYDGAKTNTIDIWGREHGKSTIITIAESVQHTLKQRVLMLRSGGAEGRDESTIIFSYSMRAAAKFLRQIKVLLETSDFLKSLFPDCLWQNPKTEAPKWSEDEGLFLKRDNNSKEGSFECSGLIDGMPTGGHYSRRIYDDVETMDIVQNPDQIERLKEAFDMSQNLGTLDGIERVVGTYYHHNGLLVYLQNKKDEINNKSIYSSRLYPSTVNGEFNGEGVFLPKERLDKLRADRKTFNMQHLLNPTPSEDRDFDPSWLLEVNPVEIPKKLYRFMAVDWAGVRKEREKKQDAWALILVGVNPYRDDLGLSDVYILDAVIEPMDLPTALDAIVKMYSRGGRILKLGVEKVGASTMELHIANHLRAKNIHISEDLGNLVKLSPAGRKKEKRIEDSLLYPFSHGKIKISQSVPMQYRDRLRVEMEKFPYWYDDGLDGLSYAFDLIKEYRFPAFYGSSEGDDQVFDQNSIWNRYERKRVVSRPNGWLVG